MEAGQKKSSNLATIMWLIFCFPLGLYLMWAKTNWNKNIKWAITALFGIIVLISFATSKTNTETKTESSTGSNMQQQTSAPPKSTPTPKPTNTIAPTKIPAPTRVQQTNTQNTSPISTETVSQKNAVLKAKAYLNYSAFSHDGLVDQLEYEQFSHADAVYGADNSGANWNDQAAKKAKSYMEYSAFSRGSLIDQLRYEKFTQEQAEYGANSVGL